VLGADSGRRPLDAQDWIEVRPRVVVLLPEPVLGPPVPELAALAAPVSVAPGRRACLPGSLAGLGSRVMMDIATAHGTPVISTTVQAIEAPAIRNSSQPSSSAMSATTGEAAGVPADARQAAMALTRAPNKAVGSSQPLRSWSSMSARPGPGSGPSAGPGTAGSQAHAAPSGALTVSANLSSGPLP
jgi:hypothetical protein